MVKKFKFHRQEIEQLCWHLSQSPGDRIDIDTIAEEMGLDWGVVYNYILFLNRIDAIAPTLTYDDDVHVEQIPAAIEDVYEDPAVAVVIYLFSHRKNYCDDIRTPLDSTRHARFFEKYEQAIEDAEDLGWVVRSDEGIGLTPKGIGVAGPVHSRINSGY